MSDRREEKNRRIPKDRRNQRVRRRREATARTAVVELTQQELRMVVLDRSDNGEADFAKVATVVWNDEGVPLQTEEGLRLLTNGFKQLVVQFGLQGVKLNLVLSGEFCVTRAMRGDSEEVRLELQRMEQRSRMYLSLGPGDKVVATKSKPIDARHVHALATACNQETLDTIYESTERAGLKTESIEPALVAVCNAVHRLPDEPEAPYMIVYVGESSAEIGVCWQGQLLLDYRPGGETHSFNLVELIQQHRKRVERHTCRQLQLPNLRISQIFLCGNQQAVAVASREFANDDSFHAIEVDPNAIQASWTFDDQLSESSMVPVLGALLTTYQPLAGREAPNFMEHILAKTREPLRPVLVRSALPFAATILIALCLWLLNLSQRVEVDALREQAAALAPVLTETHELRLQRIRAETKIKHLEKLASHLQAAQAGAIRLPSQAEST